MAERIFFFLLNFVVIVQLVFVCRAQRKFLSWYLILFVRTSDVAISSVTEVYVINRLELQPNCF